MVRLFAAMASIGCVLSCGTPTTTGPVETEEVAQRRRAVLEDLATKAVLPSYEDFRGRAGSLSSAVDAWAESGEDEDRAAAQAAWREAMLAWEIVEVFGFGPAGPMGIVTGGEDLRDAIYSWPTTNPCRVDQELVERAYEDPEAFRDENVNVRGLDALEYLLFREGTGNQCDPSRSINADGSWAELDEDELRARRGAYAKTLASDLVERSDELLAAWNDGFTAAFVNAGTSSEQFPTTREALNAASDGLFYLDGELKDMKLAEPAGLLNCGEPTCPDAREFVWAELGYAAVAANLEGAELLFSGGDGLGFDDLLADAGQKQLADDMLGAMEAARVDAQSRENSMRDDLANDVDAVLGLHAEVKVVTDLLKTQFLGVLDLELPDRADGDND